MKLGIAYSGSGFHLSFHQGVAEILTEQEVVPDVILGTSGGAVVGACHAMGKLELCRAFLLAIDEPSDIYEGSLIGSLLGGDESVYLWPRFEALAREHIRPEDFEIPFFAGLVNDTEGAWNAAPHRYDWIWKAVVASSAVIPWVPPVRIGTSQHIDGGFHFPLGDLEWFARANDLTHLIVSDVTVGSYVNPRWQANSLLGNFERAVNVLTHFIWLQNRKQIERLEDAGVEVHIILPSQHLGSGMQVKPGDMGRKINMGRSEAHAVLHKAGWL